MMRMAETQTKKTGTINIGVVYHDGKSGEEGVVLLVDRKVSMGSYGRELPGSFKLAPLAPNMSVTMAGSVGDAQEVIRKLKLAVIKDTELYQDAAEAFGAPPVILNDDVSTIQEEIHTEDIISGAALEYEKLQRKLEMASTPKQISAIKLKLSKLKQHDIEKTNERACEFLKEQEKAAAEFFEPEEFTLDTLGDERIDGKYVNRIIPVRKESWSGTKVFSTATVAFQRVNNEIFPTVDGIANFFAHTYQERMKEAGYEGLVGGVNPIDGAQLYELEGEGSVVETKTWAAEGSGSQHITALMDNETQNLMKKKGYLTRDDALSLALKGAIPVATGMDNYVAPPLDVVLIKKGKGGRIASYKVTIDLSKDKKTVIMPKSFSIDVLTKDKAVGENVYYKAKIGGKGTTLHQMPEAGHFGNPTKIENRKLEVDIRNVAGSYLKVMNAYASK